MCFYLKIIRVHVFCSNFSRVFMSCDDNHLKSVPESTRPGIFLSWTIVDNLHKKLKIRDLLLKRMVCVIPFSSQYLIIYGLSITILKSSFGTTNNTTNGYIDAFFYVHWSMDMLQILRKHINMHHPVHPWDRTISRFIQNIPENHPRQNILDPIFQTEDSRSWWIK